MDSEFLIVLREAMESGRGAVQACVVEAIGSVPREAGAKMLIFPEGRTYGTVGGGALEKRVIEEAHRLLREGRTRLLTLNLKQDLKMECGGEVKVFLEALTVTRRLVVFGGGHIGKALFTLSPLLGMAPVIVDERPEFCNKERFPRGDLYPMLPGDAAERLGLCPRDHVVIVTHGHARDLECLRLVLPCPVAYVGMIGSRKKVAHTLGKLREEGAKEEQLARVRAPIGLDLGGGTPGEIAIAIASEIIALNHGKNLDGFTR